MKAATAPADAANATSRWRRVPAWSVACAIVAVGLAVYSNAFDNPFQLDDLHSIRDNAYVRSLAHVPRYFVDAHTFTRFLPNADYRPILQVTYALDYAIAGYAPWIWHATNLALHMWVAFCVFLLGRRLIGTRRIADVSLSPAQGDWASAAPALAFVAHPAAAACVDYVSTRSSVLVAAFLMPATLLYLRSFDERRRGAYLGAVVLFVLALLTKAEAISFAALAVAAEVCFARSRGPGARWRRGVLRCLPFAALGAAYVGLRALVVPPEFAQYAAAPGVSSIQYLLTETHAWWYYVGHLVLPVRLIADYSSYPVSRSLDGRAACAIAGWSVVAFFVWRHRRGAPQILFLVAAFFVHLAPTSSIMPLTDMVNEHRPYLPSVGLFVLFGWALARFARRDVVVGIATSIVVVVLGASTFRRNTVFASEESFWRDVVLKDPDSARAQVNYGVTVMAHNRLDLAEHHIREATRIAPDYLFARINLGIVLAASSRATEARAEYDRAVQLAPKLADPFYWRALFREQQGDLPGAADDMRAAAARSPVPTRELLALARILERGGRMDEAREVVRRGAELDPAAFAELGRRLGSR